MNPSPVDSPEAPVSFRDRCLRAIYHWIGDRINYGSSPRLVGREITREGAAARARREGWTLKKLGWRHESPSASGYSLEDVTRHIFAVRSLD